MRDVLTSHWFQVGGIPLILMVLGVTAKRLGRRDGDDSPHLNDCAVGTSIFLMLLGADLTDFRSVSSPSDLVPLLSWLVGILLTTFLSIDHDRYRSWLREANGLPSKKKRFWVGVFFPNVLALAIFASYQAQKVAQ
jgi:hypothetical protein